MSQISSPAAGTTFSASPLVMTVGTAVRWSGPSGAWRAARWRATSARASRALRPFSGLAPACEARPRAVTFSVPAALRRTITASPPSGARSPASKHRHASQPANRAAWANGAWRHSSSHTSSSATSPKAAGRPASARITPSASTSPPFMSMVPEPV